MVKTFWQNLGKSARVGLIVGAVCIMAGVAGAGSWLLRTDYQVLFADLTPQDAAAMTAELEKLKVPYSVAEDTGGTTLLVDARDVHRTRLKLMGNDVPLHGGVGFELFNSSDFGMTEFAQKINYQRALQGELTRTILSLAEVREARVLLALPEQGLFRQATSKPKASITVSLKRGQALRPEQVAGIQRLVAAAVPGIAWQDVTLVDQSGVALTRAPGDPDAEASSVRLELKRETEAYLSRKAVQVLERAVGEGQAMASVDVTLDMNRVQTTTEDYLGAPQGPGRAPAGVLLRERSSARGLSAPLDGRAGPDAAANGDGSTQREVEYAVGHRVEQVVTQPGAVRRLQVVAVVKRPLSAQQQAQLRELVAGAVGASTERGDSVVVQIAATAESAVPGVASAGATAEDVAPVRAASLTPRGLKVSSTQVVSIAGALLAIGLVIVALSRRRTPPGRQPLTDAERQRALAQIRAWMGGGDASRLPRTQS